MNTKHHFPVIYCKRICCIPWFVKPYSHILVSWTLETAQITSALRILWTIESPIGHMFLRCQSGTWAVVILPDPETRDTQQLWFCDGFFELFTFPENALSALFVSSILTLIVFLLQESMNWREAFRRVIVLLLLVLRYDTKMLPCFTHDLFCYVAPIRTDFFPSPGGKSHLVIGI